MQVASEIVMVVVVVMVVMSSTWIKPGRLSGTPADVTIPTQHNTAVAHNQPLGPK
jgi:hypothetical protein